MRLSRIERRGIHGPEPRVVAIDLEHGVAIDVALAEQERLARLGYTAPAARRLADAQLPQSITQALGSPFYREALEQAVAADPPESAIVPLDEITWLVPLDPPRFRDFMSFEQHHLSARKVLERAVPEVTYTLPTYYKAGHLSLFAHEQAIPWPGYCEWMDYELELGFVVGRGGVDLTPDEAGQCLFGVILLNDFSARDRQFTETAGNLGPAKGKDFGTAVGPWIVTLDELELTEIDLSAAINGSTWSEGNSGSAMWSAAEILAYLSTCEPLVAGELVGSGTVGGGCGLELGRRLIPGDMIELRSSVLGTLRNRLSQPAELRWSPPARTPGVTIDGRGCVGVTALLPPRTDAPPPPFPRTGP